jgi:hypothetical protein
MARAWLAGTLVVTVGAFVMAIALAPPGGSHPERLLVWLLFVGSSMHVASSAWFATVPDVRRHAREHPGRYLVAPVALVATSAIVAAATTPGTLRWLLLGFFAWQFFHYQRQNLGLAAIAGISSGVGSLRPAERRAITAAGVAGIVGLMSHPELLQVSVDPKLRWLFPVSALAFAVAVVSGIAVLSTRAPADRSRPLVAVSAVSLVFFLPVFVLRSPYAAVAGLTIAHGLQYLFLMALVARGLAAGGARRWSLMLLVDVALLGGLVLNAFSHLHDGAPGARALFGVYLGVVMAHFVVDAGLWRLRDDFPRALLGQRVPELVAPTLPSG